MKELELSQITVDGGTESRQVCNEVVEDYAEILKSEHEKLPAVDVFSEGEHYWLADGFHRFHATQKSGRKTICAIIHEGGRLEALKYSLGANADHGYRRTAADKHYAVAKALTEFKDYSDRKIAGLCRVSPTFVGNVRREATVHVDNHEAFAEMKRIGKDGMSRRLPRSESVDQEVASGEMPNPGTEISDSSVQVSPLEHDGTPKPGIGSSELLNKLERLRSTVLSTCATILSTATMIVSENPGSKRDVRRILNLKVLSCELDDFVKHAKRILRTPRTDKAPSRTCQSAPDAEQKTDLPSSALVGGGSTTPNDLTPSAP